MGRLIGQMELTLDGFLTGQLGDMNWFNLDAEAWRTRVDPYHSVGTVLLGRRNYEEFAAAWPLIGASPTSTPDLTFSGWLAAVPKVVFSQTLKQASWSASVLVRRNFEQEAARLKRQLSHDLLIMNSLNLIRLALRAGLLDDLWLTVHPVTLGTGTKLFEDRHAFQLLESRVFLSGQIFLSYRVQRGAGPT